MYAKFSIFSFFSPKETEKNRNHSLVSAVALAIESGGRVHALVSALIQFNFGAFVDVAVERFVAVVRTVGHLVAHQRGVDALPVVAPELLDATRRVGLTRTIELVRIVTAIVLVVAPVRVPDAPILMMKIVQKSIGPDYFVFVTPNLLEILAGELPRRARLVLPVAFLALVRAVAAIIVVVAHPSLVDAPAVTARELIDAAVGHRRAVQNRGVLVGAVHAVRIAVAQPFPWDTLRPVPRLVRLTREFGRFVTLSIV